MRGLFGLDIDGTLTYKRDSIPKRVIKYLDKKHLDGWKIIFLTGRSYPFVIPVLSDITFPYILSTQNGSSAWHMPERKQIYKRFLDKDCFFQIDKKIKSDNIALIAYGIDHKLYWKKNEKFKIYVENLIQREEEKKIKALEINDEFFLDSFFLIKCVGEKKDLEDLRIKIEEEKKNFEISLIKEPFHENYYILLMTKAGVNKGFCISKIAKNINKKVPVIVAGNDDNDLTMFEVGDIKIAMEDAPPHVIEKADIVAPSAKDYGIIKALDEAIERISGRYNIKIAIEGLKIDCIIGVYPLERKEPQRIIIDLEVEPKEIPYEDSIDSTINYDEIVDLCKNKVREKSFKLIEILAKEILDLLFNKFFLKKAKITIKKPSKGYIVMERLER